MQSSLDEIIDDGFDIEISYNYDLGIDYDFIKKIISKVQAIILESKNKGLNDFEITDKFNITVEQYSEEKASLRKVLEKYNKCEL